MTDQPDDPDNTPTKPLPGAVDPSASTEPFTAPSAALVSETKSARWMPWLLAGVLLAIVVVLVVLLILPRGASAPIAPTGSPVSPAATPTNSGKPPVVPPPVVEPPPVPDPAPSDPPVETPPPVDPTPLPTP